MKKLLITQALALSLLIPTGAVAQISYDKFMTLVAEYKKNGKADPKDIIKEYNASRKKWAAGQQERAKKAFDELKKVTAFNTQFKAYFADKYKELIGDSAELTKKVAALEQQLTKGGTASKDELDTALAKIKQLETDAQNLLAGKTAAEEAQTQSAKDKTELEGKLTQANNAIAQLKADLEKAQEDLLKKALPESIANAKQKRVQIAQKLQDQLAKFNVALVDESKLKNKAGYLALKQEVKDALDNLIAEAALDAAKADTIVGLVKQLNAAEEKLQADFTDEKIAVVKATINPAIAQLNDAITKTKQDLQTLNSNMQLSPDDIKKLEKPAEFKAAQDKVATAITTCGTELAKVKNDMTDEDITKVQQQLTALKAIHTDISGKLAELKKEKAPAKQVDQQLMTDLTDAITAKNKQLALAKVAAIEKAITEGAVKPANFDGLKAQAQALPDAGGEEAKGGDLFAARAIKDADIDTDAKANAKAKEIIALNLTGKSKQELTNLQANAEFIGDRAKDKDFDDLVAKITEIKRAKLKAK